MSNYLFSVLIVSYKVPEILRKCLNHLYPAAENISIEVIIIDNASGDDSKHIVSAEFPDIIWLQNSKNLGFAKAVNQGIKKANGTFILLLNPDTEIQPGTFQAFNQAFRSLNHPGILGGKVLNNDGSFQTQCRRNIPDVMSSFVRLFGIHKLLPGWKFANTYELPLVNLDKTHSVEAVSGAFMCFHRDLIQAVGLFDEGYFLFGEDLDYCYRSLMNGYTNYFIPDAEVVHAKGLSREKRPIKTLFNTHHAMARFYNKHQSENHFVLFNWLIYAMIWMRWIALTSAQLFKYAFSRGSKN